MGIFDFFKSKKSKEKGAIENNIQVSEQKFSMPTIKPEKELFEYYDEVFNSMINDITGLTADETKEILRTIKKCEGGFLNMAGYYSIVWEKYFKGKTWLWNEYEEWNRTFNKLGKFPSRFPHKSNFVPTTIEESLNKLKVSELKAICTENKINFTAKAKKIELIDILKIIPDINEFPVVVKKIDEMNSKFEYELYSLFMRTISFRSTSLYDIRRAEKLGIKKFKILHVFKEDKEFVDLALKKNPKALHPVFPSDMSIKQCVIDF
jgi:hypothetical protein